MREEKVTARALGGLVYCGLLAPMFRVVPGSWSEDAKQGGWVPPLLALPLLLGVTAILLGACRRLPEGAGLPRLYTLAFGGKAGGAVTVITGLWAIVVSAAALRYYSESIIASVYQDTSVWIFLLGAMALVWRACDLGMGAISRMAGVYLYIIGGALLLLVALSLPDLRLYHLWPFWTGGWQGMAKGALPVLGVEAPMLLLLLGRTEPYKEPEGGKKLLLWLTASALTMTALRVVVIGMFGWQTAARLQIPLFSAAKEIYLLEVFERIEALVVAVWVLSDVVWIAGLTAVSQDYIRFGTKRRGGRWLLTGVVVLTIALAQWESGNAAAVRSIMLNRLQYVNLAVCYLLPLTGAAVAKIRGQI